MAVYAVSDLHGYYDVFLRGLKEIGFNDSDKLYVIGDAIDRGPQGISILQHIRNHPNMELLIGNHEVMMLDSLYCGGANRDRYNYQWDWLYGNGGVPTAIQYNELSPEERRSLLEWLNRCYVIKHIDVCGKKFCLTHSYYQDNLADIPFSELNYDDVWKIVWTSVFRNDNCYGSEDVFLQHDYEFIVGHVPVQKARKNQGEQGDYNLQSFRYKNIIDIDGGCASGLYARFINGLIFLRLDDMAEFDVCFSNRTLKDYC